MQTKSNRKRSKLHAQNSYQHNKSNTTHKKRIPLSTILLDEAKALLLEGIELDTISEEDLINLAMFRASPKIQNISETYANTTKLQK